MHYAHILDPKTVGVINTHVKMVHSEYQEISSLCVLLKMFSVKSHSLPHYRNNFSYIQILPLLITLSYGAWSSLKFPSLTLALDFSFQENPPMGEKPLLLLVTTVASLSS